MKMTSDNGHGTGLNRREFLGCAAAGAAVVLLSEPSVLGAAAAARPNDWFRKQPRVFLLDTQMPDPVDQGVPGLPARIFEKLDTRAIVEQAAAAGADTILVHAKDNQGNCYYNTRLAHKHSSIGDRDLMREYSTHGRARGLTVLYYLQLSRERRAFETPEFQARDEQGKGVSKVTKSRYRVTQEECPTVCLNGPYGEYTRQVLRELAGNYDFDGFWLDCFTWWGRVPICYCAACRASYRRDAGVDLPASTDGLARTKEGKVYLRWRQALNTKILHSFSEAIHQGNPRLTITHNAATTEAIYDWHFCDKDDYLSHEFHFNEGLSSLSLLCRRLRAVKPGLPFEIELWRFGNRLGGPQATSRDYQVRPVAALLAEMATVTAHGGFPQYYDQIRIDGTLDGKSLERLKPAFAATQQWQQFAGRGKPLGYASLLWSKNSEAMAGSEVGKLHKDDLEGVHSALMESHLPVNVMTELQAAQREWQDARVIVLPSAECLADDCLAALRSYVENGGGLVVTGRTSLATADGEPRGNFGLADLLGVDYKDMTPYYYTYLSPDQSHPALGGLTTGFPVSVYETMQTLVAARPGTTTLGVVVEPLPGFHMGYPPHHRTDHPGMTVREVGKGRVVYLSSAQGAVYSRFSHPDQKLLLAGAVTWAAGAPAPVSSDGPETLELIPWRDEAAGKTILCLVNRTGAGPAQGQTGTFVHETIPLHQITVKVHKSLAGTKAMLALSQAALPVRWEGEYAVVVVERVDEMAIVVLS